MRLIVLLTGRQSAWRRRKAGMSSRSKDCSSAGSIAVTRLPAPALPGRPLVLGRSPAISRREPARPLGLALVDHMISGLATANRLTEAGCDDGHADGVAHVRIDYRADHDGRIVRRTLLDRLAHLLEFADGQVHAGRDIHEDAASAIQVDVFQQRDLRSPLRPPREPGPRPRRCPNPSWPCPSLTSRYARRQSRR